MKIRVPTKLRLAISTVIALAGLAYAIWWGPPPSCDEDNAPCNVAGWCFDGICSPRIELHAEYVDEVANTALKMQDCRDMGQQLSALWSVYSPMMKWIYRRHPEEWKKTVSRNGKRGKVAQKRLSRALEACEEEEKAAFAIRRALTGREG